jgi:anti-sigma-K factor RskA
MSSPEGVEENDAETMSVEDRLDLVEEQLEVCMAELSTQDWAMSQMMKGVVVLMGAIEMASNPEVEVAERMTARETARSMLGMLRQQMEQAGQAATKTPTGPSVPRVG